MYKIYLIKYWKVVWKARPIAYGFVVRSRSFRTTPAHITQCYLLYIIITTISYFGMEQRLVVSRFRQGRSGRSSVEFVYSTSQQPADVPEKHEWNVSTTKRVASSGNLRSYLHTNSLDFKAFSYYVLMYSISYAESTNVCTNIIYKIMFR